MNEWNGREMICAGGTDLHESWKCSFYQYWHKSEWERKSIKVWETGNGKHSKQHWFKLIIFYFFYPSFHRGKAWERFPLQKGSGNKKMSEKVFEQETGGKIYVWSKRNHISGFRALSSSSISLSLFFLNFSFSLNDVTLQTLRTLTEVPVSYGLGASWNAKRRGRKKAALGVNRFFVTLTTFSPSS